MAGRSLRTRSSPASSTPQKRPSATVESNGKSKRTKTDSANAKQRVTPRRSQHFKPSKYTETEDDDESLEAGGSPSVADGAESGYDDDDAALSSESDEGDDDGFSSEDSRPKKHRPRPKAGAAAPAGKDAKGQELWRLGVKTGLGPGTQVIIEKPKPRAAGKTPYKDDTIHQNTMLFLSDLAKNNDREWLKMHDPDYRTSLKDFNSFIEQLQTKIVQFDETIPELPLKDIVFRIYRDIRFSPDPTPYKTHFSAAWSRTGRKGPFAAYYVQIKPGGSFVGGGLWHPEAQPIAALRRNIDRKPHKIKEMLMNANIRKEFFGGIKADERAAVKAFVNQNKENALKTKPKGFDGDHPDIDLLRLRNFTMGRRLEDSEVVGAGGLDRIAKVMECLFPLVTYLNSIVMPDEPDESDEASGDEEDDDGAA